MFEHSAASASDDEDAVPHLHVVMDDVRLTLEDQGVASFHQSFQDVLGALDTKAQQLVTR
jgi:hypothetical protein